MVKDERLKEALDKLANQRKEFKLLDGTPIQLGRLTINDCVELEKTLKLNLFGALAEMAKEGAASKLSYELQRTIFFQSIKKAFPEITIEEAGLIMSAMDPAVFLAAIAWALTGTEVPIG